SIDKRLRNTGAARLAVSERAASGFHQQRIDMSVITTVELDNLVAFCKGARETNARHRRLCPTVDHAHFFDRRHPLADELGHFYFERIRNSETKTAPRRIAHGIDNYFRRVPEGGLSPA